MKIMEIVKNFIYEDEVSQVHLREQFCFRKQYKEITSIMHEAINSFVEKNKLKDFKAYIAQSIFETKIDNPTSVSSYAMYVVFFKEENKELTVVGKSLNTIKYLINEHNLYIIFKEHGCNKENKKYFYLGKRLD